MTVQIELFKSLEELEPKRTGNSIRHNLLEETEETIRPSPCRHTKRSENSELDVEKDKPKGKVKQITSDEFRFLLVIGCFIVIIVLNYINLKQKWGEEAEQKRRDYYSTRMRDNMEESYKSDYLANYFLNNGTEVNLNGILAYGKTLADFYSGHEMFKEEAKIRREITKICEEKLGESSQITLEWKYKLAFALLNFDGDGARGVYMEILPICVKELGEGDKITRWIRKDLAYLDGY